MPTTMSKPVCRVLTPCGHPSELHWICLCQLPAGRWLRSADNFIPLLTNGLRSQAIALYVQDDWKVTPKLTLNLGLRWDIPTPLYEVKSRMSGLDPRKPNPGADGYPGAFVVLGDGPGRTGQKSFSSTYYRDFGPRVGFAYSATQKMVLRGGYGINYSSPDCG